MLRTYHIRERLHVCDLVVSVSLSFKRENEWLNPIRFNLLIPWKSATYFVFYIHTFKSKLRVISIFCHKAYRDSDNTVSCQNKMKLWSNSSEEGKPKWYMSSFLNAFTPFCFNLLAYWTQNIDDNYTKQKCDHYTLMMMTMCINELYFYVKRRHHKIKGKMIFSSDARRQVKKPVT